MIPSRSSWLTLLATSLLLAGCAGDNSPATDAGTPGADGGTGTVADAGQEGCQGCSPTQGCLVVRVLRAADESVMPWKYMVTPNPADGVGTLVVSAHGGTATAPTGVVRRTVVGADYRMAPGEQRVELGCLEAASLEARAFLDEGTAEMPGQVTSSDTFDTCGNPGKVTITAGQASTVELVLQRSCNP